MRESGTKRGQDRVSRWRGIGGLAGLLVAAWLFFPQSSQSPVPLGTHDEMSAPSLVEHLGDQLDDLDAASIEAQQLRRHVKRVRQKAQQTEPRQENPGAFREALRDIKTARDGTTYPANYKVAELRKAVANKGKSGGALPWTERGPGNVAGRARALVVDPDDPTKNTWFVATIGGGIWKTSDGGVTWTPKTESLETLSMSTLAMCQSDPDVMYAGTGMGYGRIVELEGSGVWKTIDRGETWTQLPSTADGQLLQAINRIVVDPANPDVVVLCSNDSFSHLGPKGGTRISGIFRSIDGGTSWTQTFDPDVTFGTVSDNRVQQIVADPTNFNNLYATVNEVGVIKSIDGGTTWTVSADDFALPFDVGNPTGGGFGLAGISVRTEMAIAPSDPNRLYAAVERPRSVADLYMSTDAGGTWSLVNSTNGDPNWFNAFNASGANPSYTAGWFDNTIAVNPYDENTLYVGGVNLFRIVVNAANSTRTTHGMSFWIPNSAGLPVVHADHHWIEAIPMNAGTQQVRLVNCNDGGVAVSQDGGVNWTSFAGMGTTQFYGADKKPGEDAYFGGMQDNGTWHSGANAGALSNWSFDIGGDGFEVVWNYRDPNLMLGGSQFGGLARSTDGGSSWGPAAPPDLGNAPFITKIANSKVDPDLVFTVADNGVFRSDDFGATWLRTPILGSWLGYRPFANVEVSNADPQVVWATSRIAIEPASGQAGGVRVSTDTGLSYVGVTNNLPPQMVESSGLGTSALDRDTAYLLFSAPGLPKVLRTTDLGQTFEDISGFSGPAKTSSNGFPDVATFALLEMPFDPTVLWAGTEVGLFESNDGGVSWNIAGNGIPNVAIFELSIVDDEVIAATQGRGVWSVALPQLAGYTPPAVTLSPRLLEAAQLPNNDLSIRFDLRSAYDQSEIRLNGDVIEMIPANENPIQTTLVLEVFAEETVNIELISSKDGVEYRTPARQVELRLPQATNRYTTDFNNSSSVDWSGSGFRVGSNVGFTSSAIHSLHPYNDNTNLAYKLNIPIRVDGQDPSLSYRDVAIIEEGLVTDYTNPNFFDYVIVEATEDGSNWIPLLNGYDARFDPNWLNASRLGQPGTSAMFREHTVNLQDFFDIGDLIFVRFRLFADAGVNGFGWVIDDLSIQAGAVAIEDPLEPEVTPENLPRRVTMNQNYPNPFNPSTSIRYELPRAESANLAVYDAAGRLVVTLVSEAEQGAGEHEVVWDGRDAGGTEVASGIYLYRLKTPGQVRSRKMTLIR